MVKEIRTKLIELARLKTTWSYSQLNEQLMLGLDFTTGYDRDLIGEWLGEISEHEFKAERPLLNALIVHKGIDREQGDGFYKLCESFYKKSWIELKANKNFEVERIKDCFSFWKNNDNYKKFKNDF